MDVPRSYGQMLYGHTPFRVGAETYQTWCKVVGDLGAGGRPILCVHGGGGLTHHYMLVPVIFYDHLGNGESTHIPYAPKEVWKAELWVDELENLVEHLGISNDFNLLGHSWEVDPIHKPSISGMLSGRFTATRAPAGLKNLIIASTDTILEQNPEVAAMIQKHAEAGTFADPGYLAGTQVLHKKHFYKMDPMPEDLMTSAMSITKDPTVFSPMVGPSSYNTVGNLVGWSIIDKLHNTTCPVLFISSLHDAVQPAIIPWFQNINKVKWVELYNSSHLPMFEEPERYFQVIVDFLTRESPNAPFVTK
ncbi:proline-specific peptidase [Pleurotus eryngii]|uniref:Proline-specific peptidase n=1 Tax=Pleurotus eryngii TaxID=5323 RepID=A0A9P5ZRM8_PLEER|nr:proline-specific peptidase [Pleurotus eryngii]